MKEVNETFKKLMCIFFALVIVLTGTPLYMMSYATDSDTDTEDSIEQNSAEETSEDASEESENSKDAAEIISDEGSAPAEETQKTQETGKNEEVSKPETEKKAADEKTSETKLTDQTVMTEDKDGGYVISVSGMLPEGASLMATEIEADSHSRKLPGYYELVESTAEKIYEKDKYGEGDTLPYARFFDITILDKDGKEFEPEEAVALSIDLKDKALNTKDVDFTAVHFTDDNKTELIPIDIQKTGKSKDADKAAVIEAESFSIYGVVYSYTVDFYYTSGETNTEYHMNGGSEMMMSDLFDKLGIGRNTKDIKSVEFTDESLVSFTKDGSDYRIKSLKPFTTGEQLNITFKDGSAVIIRVEDAAEDNRTPDTENNINWNLETDGTLTIRPKNNVDSASFATVRTSQDSWDPFWKHGPKVPGGESIRSEVKKVIIKPNNKGTGISLNAEYSHLAYMFSGFTNLESVEIKAGAFEYSTRNLGYMFNGCSNLTEIKGLEYLDTSSTDQMQRMFSDCKSLKEVNISSWENKGIVYNMQNMFNGCTALETVTMPGKDFKVKDGALLAGMFEGCISLTSVDFGASDDHDDHMDVTGAKTMTNMFKGCTALKKLDVSTFGKLTKIVNMDGFVEGCTALEELNISNMDNSAIEPKRGFHPQSGDPKGLDWGHDLGIDPTSTPKLKTLIAGKSKVYMCTNVTGSPDNQPFDASYNSNILYFTHKQADFTFSDGVASDGVKKKSITTKRDYIDLITARHETGDRGNKGKTENVTNKMFGLNTNGAGFLAPGTYKIGDKDQDDPEPENIPSTRYRITGMNEGVEKRIAVDNPLLEQDGESVRTVEQKRDAWGTDDYTIKNAGGDPVVTITYKNAAEDFYGKRHNVVIKVKSITFKDLGKIPYPEDRTHNSNYYAGDTYYRTVLKAEKKNGGLVFQNYVYSSYAKTGSGAAAGHQRVLSNGSGTYIDFDISIPDAPQGSTLMFYIDDLDVPHAQDWYHHPSDMCYDYLPWSEKKGVEWYGVTYGSGSEGMRLLDGNNLKTLTFAEHTGLQILDQNYIVATGSDPSTSWSEFYVQANATGASYEWTSGISCDTILLKNTEPPEKPAPATLGTLKAKKFLDGRHWKDGDEFYIALIAAGEDAEETPLPEGFITKDEARYSLVKVTSDCIPEGETEDSYLREKTFGTIRYSLSDIIGDKKYPEPEDFPKSFYYDIQEFTPAEVEDGKAIPGISYSDENYQVKVTVDLDDKSDPDKPKLYIKSVEFEKNGTAASDDVITNTYAADQTIYEMEAFKVLHNINTDHSIPVQKGDYDFVIRPIGDNAEVAPMPENSQGSGAGRTYKVSNDNAGLIVFADRTLASDGLVFNYRDLINKGFTPQQLQSDGVEFEYEIYEVIPEAGTGEIKVNNNNGTWSVIDTSTNLHKVYDGIHHTRKIIVKVRSIDDPDAPGKKRDELYVDSVLDDHKTDFYIDKDGKERPVTDIEGYHPDMYHVRPSGAPIFVNFRFQQYNSDLKIIKKWDDKYDRDGIRPSSVNATIKSDAFEPLDETFEIKGLLWQKTFKDMPAYKFDLRHKADGSDVLDVHDIEISKVSYELEENMGGVINGDENTGYAPGYDFDSPFTLDKDENVKVLTITNTHVPEDMYKVTYLDGDHGRSNGGSEMKKYGEKPQNNTVTPDKGWEFTGEYSYVITNKSGKVIDKGTTRDPVSITVTGNIVFTPYYKEIIYTVTYENGDHGKSDGGKQDKKYGETPQSNTVTPDKGYRFTGKYKYVITDKNGNVIETGTTDDPQSIKVIGDIVFTPVYEKLPDPDNPDPDNPENGSRKGGSSGTNTGDSTNVALWIGLLAAAGIGFGTVYKRRKRSK